MDTSTTLQGVPGQKQAETALDNLAGQGILGSLCVIMIIALFFAVRAILRAKDDRIGDQRMMIEALQKLNDASRELAIELNKASSNLVVESTKNHDAVKNALTAQDRSLTDLVQTVRELRDEELQLRVAVTDLRHTNGRSAR
jgi:uncharacterized membrane protein YhiD involved in acid resistance